MVLAIVVENLEKPPQKWRRTTVIWESMDTTSCSKVDAAEIFVVISSEVSKRQHPQ